MTECVTAATVSLTSTLRQRQRYYLTGTFGVPAGLLKGIAMNPHYTSAIRHALGAIGFIAIAQGWIEESSLNEIISSVMFLISVSYGQINAKKTVQLEKEASP